MAMLLTMSRVGALLLLAALLAQRGENQRLVLVRSDVASGGQGENARLVLTVAQSVQCSAVRPGATRPTSSCADYDPGLLAPASDRAGLITQARVGNVLLGLESPAEPLAIDFAGNRDGRIGAADLVTLTNKQLP